MPKTERHVLTADIGETNSRMEPARALKCGQLPPTISMTVSEITIGRESKMGCPSKRRSLLLPINF